MSAAIPYQLRKARIFHFCQGGSWTPSCGRKIEAGEQYASFHRAGLSAFAVCKDCVAIALAMLEARQPKEGGEA